MVALVMLGIMSACKNKKEESKEPAAATNVIYMIGDGMGNE